jgi:nucleotide-binding universal stress UspA family protein
MFRGSVGSRQATRRRDHAFHLRRILVALDGTPFAEAALPTAISLARTFGAEVVLVRARAARSQPIHTRLSLRRHERETLTRASLYLARIEQELLADGVRAQSVSPVGRAADTIADVAARGCDLVVIATHAGGPLTPASQVSVARELATRCDVPMLLLSPAATGLFTSAAGAPTFTLALDGERRDVAARQLTASLAATLGGSVIAVCSKSDPGWTHGSDSVGEHLDSRIATYLEGVRTEFGRHDILAWTLVVDGDLMTDVAHLARGHGALIVLGSHGTLARREATAEVAAAVLHSAESAVLLVPQEPLLTALPGGQSVKQTRGGDR